MKLRRKLLSRLGDDLEVLQRLQLADIATMAPDFAADQTQRAGEYQRVLAATDHGWRRVSEQRRARSAALGPG